MVFMQSFKHNHLQVSEDEQNDRLSSQSISGKLRKKDKKEPFPLSSFKLPKQLLHYDYEAHSHKKWLLNQSWV